MISVDQAVTKINNQGVVALPTETVYGLGASIESEVALKKIFTTKKRPLFDPLIVHICSIEMAKSYVSEWPKEAQALAEAFWPGPLTLVLPKNDKISELITAGHKTVGLRWPKHTLFEQVIDKTGSGIAAPSANLFGKTSPTEAKHVEDEFAGQISVLDGGPCNIGLESTVVGITKSGLEIYRPGFITEKDLKDGLKKGGLSTSVTTKSSPVAPGQLEKHYRPDVPVIIYNKHDQLLEFLESELQLCKSDCAEIQTLGKDVQILARELYGQLRDLSKTHKAILVQKTAEQSDDLWAAYWNRLDKAASYKL